MKWVSSFVTLLLATSCLASDTADGVKNREMINLSVSEVSGGRDVAFIDLPPLEPGLDFHVSDPDLERLLRILLHENPDILAARRNWKASLERPAQVRSLPDPSIGLRYFAESIETRVGPQRASIELAQRVPWLSKLSTEGRRAEKVAASLRESVRKIERDRVRDFKAAYFNLAYLDAAIRINKEEQQLLHRFEQIALTRYATGEGIQQNIIKVQTEITRLIDQRTFLRERRDIFERRLAQLLGRSESVLEMRILSLEEPDFQYDVRALEAEALEARPALRAIREQIQGDEFLVERRRLDFRPDFRFGLSFTDVGRRTDPAGRLSPPPDDGEDAIAFVAGISIPLYTKRISSGIREAREILGGDILRLDSEEDKVRFDVQEAMLRLDSLVERTALYRDNLIPQAEQSLSSTEAAYQTNQIDFLDLLDAERVWFQVRLTYQRLVSDLWIALADSERAIGRKFPSTFVEGMEPDR